MAADTEREESSKPPTHGQSRQKLLRWLGAVGLLLLAAVVILFAVKWPFTRDSITRRLERHGIFKVTIGSFHSTYFPPGCVAENVEFRRGSSWQTERTPLATVRKLTIQATYSGLIGSPKHIQRLIVDGVEARLPHQPLLSGEGEQKPGGREQKPDTLVIDDAEIRNGVLKLQEDRKASPYFINVHELRLHNVNLQKTIPFAATVHIPRPDGEVRVNGWVGPAPQTDGGTRNTPLSGSYEFNGQLGVFRSITGRLASRGEFKGNLTALNVSGTTDSPDFGVTRSVHRFHLSTRFASRVDLKTGDVQIPDLNAQLGETRLLAEAEIAIKEKTVRLNVKEGDGEIQDLLDLFSDSAESPMTGPIKFKTSITLPQKHEPFKERVLLSGDFNINPAHFTSGKTQINVDKLSAKARGKKDEGKAKGHEARNAGRDTQDPNPVISDLKGHVELKDGIARFSQLSFSVPGASARMAGTYNMMDKRVDLHGKMSMQAKLSQATTGAKSFFLKILDPFFKKKHAGAVIPVAMTGSYGHTHFHAGPGN